MISKRAVAILAVGLVAGGAAYVRAADLAEQAREARTPEEHARVARAYRERADQLRTEAAPHEALAKWAASQGDRPFGGEGTTRYEDAAQHCRAVVAGLKQAAEEMDALARIHETLAVRSGTTTKQ